MAPGAKTPRRFHQDNRAFWIVQDGQIRFTIEGQEPFVATRGFLVQVPKRLVYSMETVGDRPSLRFEVLMANSQTMYPADETPPPTPGIRFEKTRVADSKGSYDEANVPYIDYNLTIAGKQKPKKNPTQFIGDAHDGNYLNVGIANILRGDPKTQTPLVPGDKGHLHVTGPEFWFILEGKMEFTIGSVPTFANREFHPRREDGIHEWLGADLRRRSRGHRLCTGDGVAPGAIRGHRDGDEACRRGLRVFARVSRTRRRRQLVTDSHRSQEALKAATHTQGGSRWSDVLAAVSRGPVSHSSLRVFTRALV